MASSNLKVHWCQYILHSEESPQPKPAPVLTVGSIPMGPSGKKPEGHLTVIFLSWKQGQKKALDGKRRHEMALTQGDGFEGKSEKSEQKRGLVKNGFIRLITPEQFSPLEMSKPLIFIGFSANSEQLPADLQV
jgi:hypothetical protein